MKLTFTLALISSFFLLQAQNHPSCDGQRYRTDVFAEVMSTTALKYSEDTTIAGNFQELFLDVYEPVGDTADTRPVVIVAFGGSFISGERNDLQFLCEAYATKGYVAVTIDYRLYDLPLVPFPTEQEMKDVVTRAVVDMKAAIRYMRADAATANQFRIDPDLVFVGGVSAGAIAAAHTAYLDSTDVFPEDLEALIEANGVFDNTGFNSEYSSEVQGVVNFSGALNDASWISTNEPPLVSIHDEFDSVVPYETGFAVIFGFPIVYLEGSQVMHQKADSLGITNELMTLEGSFGHVSYFTSGDQATADAINFSAEFLYDIICPELVSVTAHSPVLSGVSVYPQPTAGVVYVKNDNNLALRLKLYNGVGQLMGSWERVSQIDLSAFAEGVYHLRMEDINSQRSQVETILLTQ